MRLKSLKLVGFKSFVDPTLIYFPSNLVGIVGPNGSGKSNIIDAIRWVIGESSPKQLRGDSMSDVVFNGSNTRKPVSQATVELIFDNESGKIGSEYANYREIAIKRQVMRDGESAYFINGTSCRRKDILDILMGTGLGRHTYSIIEQGMISRFIEAKADDLRMIFEEAAGISKYKERRKETEQRIRHTRENLTRLNDVYREVIKQLEWLQDQAHSAERYKRLKEEEHDWASRILVWHWKQYDTDCQKHEKTIHSLEVKLEEKTAEQYGLFSEIEKQRQRLVDIGEQVHTAHKAFYELKQETAQQEQALVFHEQQKTQWNQDLLYSQQNKKTLIEQLRQDKDRHDELNKASTELNQALTEIRTLGVAASAELADAEKKLQACQEEVDFFLKDLGKHTEAESIEKTKLHYLEQQMLLIHERLVELKKEQEKKIPEEEAEKLTTLAKEKIELNTRIQIQEKELDVLNQAVIKKRERIEQGQKKIFDTLKIINEQRERLAALRAWQENLISNSGTAVAQWLAENHLTDRPRLIQQLQVASGWEWAVETVLAPYLQGIYVENLNAWLSKTRGLKEGKMILFNAQSEASDLPLARTLSQQIQSNSPVRYLLNAVYCADHLEEALALKKHLKFYESVITPEGIWLGQEWIYVNKPVGQSAFKREKELTQLISVLGKNEKEILMFQAELETEKTDLIQLELNRNELQQDLLKTRLAYNQLESFYVMKKTEYESTLQRFRDLDNESQSQRLRLKQYAEQLEEAQAKQNKLALVIEAAEATYDPQLKARTTFKEALSQAQEKVLKTKETEYSYTLNLEKIKMRLTTLEENRTRMEAELKQLEEKQFKLESLCSEADQIEVQLQKKLKIQLSQLAEQESHYKIIESTLAHSSAELKEKEQQLERIIKASNDLKIELQNTQIQRQTAWVHRSNHQAQLDKLSVQPDTLLAEMNSETTLTAFEEELQKVTARLARLGAINLAAADEIKAQEDRKRYLDEQVKDLTEALATLETAMHKIDTESEIQFNATFHAINENFKALFPRVFGGGSAALEMNQDTELGIQIIARPPGKRNTSIHLLSGGEKALTAVSLIFSIFQLNPAPFCLLDEVDAPLDDLNIERFKNLLQEMANKIQFIFISHNKIAIEVAQHLMGITMREPGVSHIVAVDIEEALRTVN